MKVLLAQKLREFRKKQGLTQEQLAEAMGVTIPDDYVAIEAAE